MLLLAAAIAAPATGITEPDRRALAALALADGLLVAFWLYSGYEKLSVLAGEVEDPSRSFPRALAIAVPLSAASYVLPPLVGLAVSGDWADCGDSHFTAAAQAIGGTGLAALMAAGGLVSNAGLLLVTVTGQSRLPMVLAEDGLFPKGLARIDPRYGTPWASLLLGGLVLTVLSLFPFSQLIGIYGPVQALAYLLIYASAFRLRRRDVPQVEVSGPSPFRIPLGTGALTLLAAPGTLLMVLVVVQGLGRELWKDGRLDVAAALVQGLALFSVPRKLCLVSARLRSLCPLPSSRSDRAIGHSIRMRIGLRPRREGREGSRRCLPGGKGVDKDDFPGKPTCRTAAVGRRPLVPAVRRC